MDILLTDEKTWGNGDVCQQKHAENNMNGISDQLKNLKVTSNKKGHCWNFLDS